MKPDDTNGMARHESGLIVPTDLARKRAVWTEDDAKLLRRVQGWSEVQELNVILQCKVCKKPVEWRQGSQGPVAECACKRREFI